MLGIDIVSVERIEKIIQRKERFLTKIFSEEEVQEIKNRKNFYEALAGKFACKEAVIKALGGGLSPKDISVMHKKDGSPYVILSSRAKKKFESFMVNSIAVSISHDGGFAIAVAILVKEAI